MNKIYSYKKPKFDLAVCTNLFNNLYFLNEIIILIKIEEVK